MKKLIPICSVLVMLIANVVVAHDHYGNSNESVTPTEVIPGDTVDVHFDYEIWHIVDAHGPVDCPWEVRLDGTAGVRDGILLASGSNQCASSYGETFNVDAHDLTIPIGTSLGAHTIKIVTDVDDFEYSPVYSYLSITVIPLEVDVDIKPGSCPNAFNSKGKGILPVAIVGSEDFDAALVDPATITLEGVSPVDWGYDDSTEPIVDPDCYTCFDAENPANFNCDLSDDDIYEDDAYCGDGFLDMILKFNNREIAAAVAGPGRDDCFEPVLMGYTLDGVPIIGSDFMIMKTK